MDLHASIRKSSIWMIARLAVSMTVGVFVTTYIIRSLSVEDYGIYTVLYSFIGYVGVIGSFGVPEVFRRFIPEALQKKQYGLLKQLVFRGLVLRLLLSAATVGVILALQGPVGRLLKLENFLDYFSIFAFGIVLSLEASLLTSVLHSLFLHKYSVIAGTIHTVFRGACVFVLLQMGWGIRGVLWAEVIAWGLWVALLARFYYWNFSRQHPTKEQARLPLRRYFRFGGFAAFNKAGESLLGVSTDFFVITAFLGPGAVALYAFANRVLRMLTRCLPQNILLDVIRPTFYANYARRGSSQDLRDMFNLLVKIGAFFTFPLAAGILSLGDQMIVHVFKPEYLEAKPILWILTATLAIGIFTAPTGFVLLAIEKPQIGFYSKVFAIYNLIAELLVIQGFGVMGVVLVTCSAIVMKNLFIYCFARRFVGLRIDWRGLLSIAVNATLMGVILVILRPFVTGILSLAIVAAAGGCGYLICGWVNKAFTPRERGWVNRVAPRPVFVF